MKNTGKWLIGIAIGVAFIFVVELSIGGFALYIHRAMGEVREQQRGNTTLLQSFDKRLEDLRDTQNLLRSNDLTHMETRLVSVDSRLGAIEEDIKALLSRGKGR